MTFFNLMVSLRRNYETEKVVFLNYAAKHFSHNEVFFAQMHKPCSVSSHEDKRGKNLVTMSRCGESLGELPLLPARTARGG